MFDLTVSIEQKVNFCEDIGIFWLHPYVSGDDDKHIKFRKEHGLSQIYGRSCYDVDSNTYKLVFHSEESRTKFMLKYC